MYKDHSTSILAESDDSKEENRNEVEIKKNLDVVDSKQVENQEQIPNNISGIFLQKYDIYGKEAN